MFPCPSPCAEQAEKARGLATPCRVTFERRTPRRFFIKLRSHDGPAEKPAKAQKLVCSRFKDFFYIGCMVILYGGNSCSGQPYSFFHFFRINQFLNGHRGGISFFSIFLLVLSKQSKSPNMASEAGQAGRQIWQNMAFLGVLEQSSL